MELYIILFFEMKIINIIYTKNLFIIIVYIAI